MDGQNCKQSVLDFKCRKPGIVAKQNLETKFASQTPEKTSQPLHTKPKEAEIELQQRYDTILQLFDSISSSLRLLGLRKKSPTFKNICTQVEVLTQRKFSYRQLAQIKYILPEALQIDKILVHDKQTLCMKPDMKIILLFDIIEGHCEQSDFIALHQLFASRLMNYFTVHPEVCDIPEATLPHPFNQNLNELGYKAGDTLEPSFTHSSIEDPPIYTEIELLSKSSHLHPSFSRHFSQKVFHCKKESTQLLASPLRSSLGPSDNLHHEVFKITHLKNNEDIKILSTGEFPETGFKFDSLTILHKKNEKADDSLGTLSEASVINPPPDQSISFDFSVDARASASPLCNKSSPSVDALKIETPAQSITKRALPNSYDKQITIACQKQTSSHVAAKRALDFSYPDDVKCASECFEPSHDIITQLMYGSSVLRPKVEDGLAYALEDHNKNQFDTMHQQMSVCLSDLVSLIHHIFQSKNYCPITKAELVHKIIVNSLDFVERGEVEKQIEIVERLVPEWIWKQQASSGDVLYNIKKMVDLDSVQATVLGK